MGTINVAKTCAQSLGPVITGVLGTKNHFWVAFVAAGSLKATYDLGLLALFAERKSREDKVANRTDEEQQENNRGNAST